MYVLIAVFSILFDWPTSSIFEAMLCCFYYYIIIYMLLLYFTMHVVYLEVRHSVISCVIVFTQGCFNYLGLFFFFASAWIFECWLRLYWTYRLLLLLLWWPFSCYRAFQSMNTRSLSFCKVFLYFILHIVKFPLWKSFTSLVWFIQSVFLRLLWKGLFIFISFSLVLSLVYGNHAWFYVFVSQHFYESGLTVLCIFLLESLVLLLTKCISSSTRYS